MRPVYNEMTGTSLIELSSSILHATSPSEKFYLEPSKQHEGLVHIRCCVNNKYWVAEQHEHDGRSAWFICGGAAKPSCTLFEFSYIEHQPVHEHSPAKRTCYGGMLVYMVDQAAPYPWVTKKMGSGTNPHWTRPFPRQFKINVDASFIEDLHEGSTGAVIRDYHGKFIAASTVHLPHVASAAMAEALAMKEGLALANRLGMSVVIAESDSLETVEACTGDETWWNESAAIFADCVDLITNIGSVTFTHCPREANRVADSLARQCFSSKISCNWVDEPPDFLLDDLLYDVTMVDG